MAVIAPKQSLEQLAEIGFDFLSQVIAIDSQSDAGSQSIPSTEGQRNLSNHLRTVFEGMGISVHQDAHANLIATIPGSAGSPKLALMAHIDTSEGTIAVSKLEEVPKWDGSVISFPKNDRMEVSAERYAATQPYVGDDVLHGPGDAPIGLDDKLGMSEMMTLAAVLTTNPQIPHGDVLLVFRPDEEIGRMEAVVGLATTLQERGVSHGYTIDGLDPFDINVENFNASGATVQVPVETYAHRGGVTGQLVLHVQGVKTHGATAKAEGYLNAIVIAAHALRGVDRNAVELSSFESEPTDETNATLSFALTAADDTGLSALKAQLLAAFEAQVTPAAWRGAGVSVVEALPIQPTAGLWRVIDHVQSFLTTPGPTPLLSEDSEWREGYSNPNFVRQVDQRWVLSYRLRDFEAQGLKDREEHLRRVVDATGVGPVEIEQQYINMGPALANAPELPRWAEAALPDGVEARHSLIRGGTGVDPFLAVGIPVANLGTGYFAPESEKELTSRQNIGRHALWLVNLVQVVAGG